MKPKDVRSQLRKTGLDTHRNIRIGPLSGIYIVWTWRDYPAYHEDDGLTRKEIFLQVDIWGKNPPEDAMDNYAEQVEDLMREMGFDDVRRDDEYEDLTGMHRVMQTMRTQVEV